MPQRSQLRRRQSAKTSHTREKETPSSSPITSTRPTIRSESLRKLFVTFEPLLLALRAIFLGLLSAASLTRNDAAVLVFVLSLSSMFGGLLFVYISILNKRDPTPVELPPVHRPDGTVIAPQPINVKEHDQKIANYYASELPALAIAAAWLYLWSSLRPALLAYAIYVMYRLTYHPLFRIHLFNQPDCPEFQRPWGGAPLFRNSPEESVKVVTGSTEFDQALEDAGEGKLVVVDFSASWCAPCKAMVPVFKKLADDFSDCVFLTVDVDVSQDVATKMSVSSVPTFILFKDGERVEMMRGATSQSLRESIERQM